MLATHEVHDYKKLEKEDDGGKTVRIQMLIPPQSVARLEALKEMTKTPSSSEVIRNAIQVYEALVRKEVLEGANILVRESDGSISQLRIL